MFVVRHKSVDGSYIKYWDFRTPLWKIEWSEDIRDAQSFGTQAEADRAAIFIGKYFAASEAVLTFGLHKELENV
jgi:hypothetical protein